MAATSTDLYAFGSSQGPRPPRPGKDVFPDAQGMIGPELPPRVRGASLFGDPQATFLKGRYYLLPAGTELPEGVELIADGRDVDPSSHHAPTHHSIYPVVIMDVDDFIGLFVQLPWQYAGRK